MPPSTQMFCPVMNADSSEARKTTRAAISSERPRREVSACRSMVACTASRSGFSPITMKPGDIALHLIPCLPNSVAAYRVRLTSAALDAP